MVSLSAFAGDAEVPHPAPSPFGARLRTTRRLAVVVGTIATAMAAAVLLGGWLLDIAIIRRLPGHPGIAITTAFGAFCVAAITTAERWPALKPRRVFRRLIAVGLLAVAAVDIALLVGEPGRGLDDILFGFSGHRGEIYMSPATAVCLALSAACLLLPARRTRVLGVEPHGLLTAAGLVITVFALTGYVFDSASLQQVFVFAALSPQTALLYWLVFLALALSRPALGWMPRVIGRGPGSATLRRTLPFVAMGPFLLSWLTLAAVVAGLFNANFRLSVLAIAGAGGLVALLAWSAGRENAEARRVERTSEALRRALSDRDILLREVYHRVKNNLQFIDAMLALEADGIAKDFSDAPRRLSEIRRRVHALSFVHQQLVGARDLATLNLGNFLRELCANLAWGVGLDEQDVFLHVDIPPVQVDLDRAVPIGLVVTELLSNAAKHAFPGETGGSAEREGGIVVQAQLDEGDVLILHFSDNGVGKGEPATAGGKVGSLIVESLVTQLSAEMTVTEGAGRHIELKIPLRVE
jgi:two-component sensor histidine kinase